MKLIKFVESVGGNVSLAKQIVNVFLAGDPPSVTSSLSSSDCHPAYKSKQAAALRPLVKIKMMVIERWLYWNARQLMPQQLDDENKIYDQKLLLGALEYAHYGVGNCSHRCSFAAIILVQALRGTGQQVKVSSNIARDQYYILLGTKARPYIYMIQSLILIACIR